ncbi:MAG: hypothetical protein ACK5RL_11280 [Acidimicrobiales bacterium]
MILAATALVVGVGFQLLVSGAEADGIPGSGDPDIIVTGPDEEAPERAGYYAGVSWTIGEVVVEPATGLLDKAAVEVDVTLTNTLHQSSIRLSPSIATLVAADGGTATDARFVNEGRRLVVEPGETVNATLRYVEGFSRNPDPNDLALVVGKQGREPLTLPLTGTPSMPLAQMASIGDNPVAVPDPGNPSGSVVVIPESAVITLDAGQFRAAEGEELIVVTTTVQVDPDEAAIGTPGFWGLDVDDVDVVPLVVHAERQAAGSQRVVILFAVPNTAESMTLVAAPDSDDPARYPLIEAGHGVVTQRLGSEPISS